MNPDLHAFVREALTRGTSRDDVRKALRDARWPDDEIEAELSAWHDAGLGVPVPRRRLGFSPREAFLYLLLFVALYLVAYNGGAILFAFVEHTWPDPALNAYEGWDRTRDWVRWALSSVVVAFPVYLYTSRVTGRAVAADPEKRNSGVRRWLTYLTLFNAACVLIGDFQLCATFDAPDSVGPYGTAVDPFWRHGAGHTCFTFEVRRPLARPAN